MAVTRRGLLGGAALSAVAALTACQPAGAGGRLATQGHAAPSPSGDFVALVASSAEGLRPMIRRADGQTMWIDEAAHDPHAYPLVVWETTTDILWVLSSEHGNAAVQREDGDWEKSLDTEDVPGSIADLTR